MKRSSKLNDWRRPVDARLDDQAVREAFEEATTVANGELVGSTSMRIVIAVIDSVPLRNGLDLHQDLSGRKRMETTGVVHNGVIVIDGGIPLPEGTRIRVSI